MQRRKRNIFNGLNMTPAIYGANYWWRAGSGITESAGNVVGWTDVISGQSLVQGTAGNRPLLKPDGSIEFDGVDNFLATGAFTLNQPFTVYLYAQQVSWTANDIIFDGFSYQSAMLAQGGVSPQVFAFAGAIGPVNGDWIEVGNIGRALAVVFNGASSTIDVDNTAGTTTGNASTQNAGGFTLGSGGAGTGNFSNIRVWEVIINNGADDATRRELFLSYLKRRNPI